MKYRQNEIRKGYKEWYIKQIGMGGRRQFLFLLLFLSLSVSLLLISLIEPYTHRLIHLSASPRPLRVVVILILVLLLFLRGPTTSANAPPRLPFLGMSTHLVAFFLDAGALGALGCAISYSPSSLVARILSFSAWAS